MCILHDNSCDLYHILIVKLSNQSPISYTKQSFQSLPNQASSFYCRLIWGFSTFPACELDLNLKSPITPTIRNLIYLSIKSVTRIKNKHISSSKYMMIETYIFYLISPIKNIKNKYQYINLINCNPLCISSDPMVEKLTDWSENNYLRWLNSRVF